MTILYSDKASGFVFGIDNGNLFTTFIKPKVEKVIGYGEIKKDIEKHVRFVEVNGVIKAEIRR